MLFRDHGETPVLSFFVLIGLAFGGFAGCHIGHTQEQNRAVRAGVAEWVPHWKTGEPTFRYKDTSKR